MAAPAPESTPPTPVPEKPTEYTIRTIGDLRRIVTRENFKNLVQDLTQMLWLTVRLKEQYPDGIVNEDLLWIDDGKHDVTLHLHELKSGDILNMSTFTESDFFPPSPPGE